MLLDYYYSAKEQSTEGETVRFLVTLNKDCDIYNGHFPDMPVAPGVCNIQMIKECTELATGKQLLLKDISQCKLITLITPEQHPELQVDIQLLEQTDTVVKIKATIGQDNREYLILKGECEVLN